MTARRLTMLLSLALGLGFALPAFATTFRPVLADTAFRDTDPAPSPDGKWLAFQSNRGKSSQIWLLPLDSSGPPRKLTSEPDSSQAQGAKKIGTRVMTPTWAPDSKSLLYISTRTGTYNIYTIPVDGGTPTALSNAPGSQRFAVYSPDGAKICFPSSRLEPNSLFGFSLYVMDAKGEVNGPPAKRLTFSGGGPGHPIWSMDGRWIGYVSKDYDTTRTVDMGGGMQTKQTPMFSPYRVFRIPAEGGKEIKLTGLTASEEGEDTWPSFSPDGKWVAFGRNIGGKQNIWIMDVATKKSFPLTTDGNCMKPTWSYDGQSIYYSRLNKGNDEDLWVAKNLTLAVPASKPAAKKTPAKK